MRVETVVTVTLDEAQAETMRTVADRLLPGASFAAGTYQVRFRHAPDQARSFAESLSELDIPFQMHEERRFSTDEIERAPALHIAPRSDRLRTRRALPPHAGTCPHALTDASAAGALVVLDPASSLPVFGRSDQGEIVVDERIAEVLIRQHISGCLLRPVQGADGSISAHFELVPTNRLPPMHAPPTRFTPVDGESCPVCGQRNLALASLPFYDVSIESLSDVNITYERFAGASDPVPELMVSQRLYRALRDCGVEDFAVEPVLFV